MLNDESKLDERNKESLAPVDNYYKNTPVVSSNLESNKWKPEEKDLKKKIKNKKSNVKASLEEVLTVHDTLPWKVNDNECYENAIEVKNDEQIVVENDEQIGVEKDRQIGIGKDEQIRIKKDERIGAEKDEHIGVENNEQSGVEKAKHIEVGGDERIGACDKWKEKVYEFKTWMNEIKRTVKRGKTYPKPHDQGLKGDEKREITEVTACKRQAISLTPEITTPVLNDRPKEKKKP
ncbi:8550_t:CDS:2 [Cetraspora pellucida]|uniref:8550_t:CDS:1 n=1 Tax=Cetraspora pellucida TaxID=1433469 RepID=A0A9N9GTJ2_9GLOM|nr:8550_t:CDS:2 [Cetraspora pellucida]